MSTLTRVCKCAGNAEDMFVISEFLVARDIYKLPFKLFIGVREVANQFFVGGGCKIVIVQSLARDEGIAIFDVLQSKVKVVFLIQSDDTEEDSVGVHCRVIRMNVIVV